MSQNDLLDRYRKLTSEALAVAQAAPVRDAQAHVVLDMAARYVADAEYFMSSGDWQRALAAFSYAHGWLDCGARLALFEVHDDRLFVVDPKSDKSNS
jgi:hypothetical protein